MLALLLLPALAAPYDTARDALIGVRARLAAQYAQADATERAQLRDQAREAVLNTLDNHVFPAWYGTAWDFYGTSTTPGEGEIACGYFISTTLLHSGFRVERIRLAQQASEHIIQSFVPEPAIARFRDRPLDEVLAHLGAEGDGLYLIGLDNHVGYLRQQGAQTRFCHSSYVGDSVVVCEPAAEAVALSSRYRVVGKLFDDAMIESWLREESFATVGPMTE